MHHTSKTPVMVISRISAHYPTKAAALVIIHGEELGRKFDLCEPRIVIGRSADAGIEVDHRRGQPATRGADDHLGMAGCSSKTWD